MKTFHSVQCGLLVVLASFSASAAEKIEGAFGKKLGDTFDPAAAIGKSKLSDGTPTYQFSPEKGFRAFTKYYVLITPTTQKIYCIWGTGDVGSTGIGKKEQSVVMELLKEKYGVAEKPGLFDDLEDARRVDQGDRYILSKISGFDGLEKVKMDLRYYDKELKKLAEKERIAAETKKIDKGGL